MPVTPKKNKGNMRTVVQFSFLFRKRGVFKRGGEGMRYLLRETIKMLFIHILLAEEFFYLGFELLGGSRVISIERLLKH